MEHEFTFHTQLPVQRRDDERIERPWITTTLTWQDGHSAPRISEFLCDDDEIVRFWNSEGGITLEYMIINDAQKLYYHNDQGRLH